MADLYTWDSSLDNAAADYSTSAKSGHSLLYLILKQLIATGYWAVAGSCDGSTGAMDGVDRFGAAFDDSKWVYGTGNAARSWWVLYNATLGVYLCCDLSNSESDQCRHYFYISPMPFTVNGTNATWQPTSTMVQVVNSESNKNAIHDGTTVLPHRLNLVFSSRGDFWMWIKKDGSTTPYWALAVTGLSDLDADASDLYPVVAYTYGYGGNNPFTIVKLVTYAYWTMRSGGGGVVTGQPSIDQTSWGCAVDYISAAGGQWRKKFLGVPIRIWVQSASPFTWSDYKGTLPDVEWCSINAPLGFGNLPTNPTRRAMWNLWLPGMPVGAPSY